MMYKRSEFRVAKMFCDHSATVNLKCLIPLSQTIWLNYANLSIKLFEKNILFRNIVL